MPDYVDADRDDSTYEIQQETLVQIMKMHGNLPAVDRLNPEPAQAVRDIEIVG